MDGNETASSDVTRTGNLPLGSRFLPVLVPLDQDRGTEWFLITQQETLIGRGQDVDFMLRDEAVSRVHAKIVHDNIDHPDVPPECHIEDGKSRNGTYLNGRRIKGKDRLTSGDQIFLGNTTLVYYLRSEAEVNADRRLRHLATTDALTGLMNRGYLATEFNRELDRARRYQRPLSLLLADADNFKAVNDNHGHLAGDEVLRQLATIILGEARSHDLCGRYGGEEFTIMLPETGDVGANTFAERLRRAVEQHDFELDNLVLRITISIGMASLDLQDASQSLEDLIGRADAALLKAKAEGKNRVICAPMPDRQEG